MFICVLCFLLFALRLECAIPFKSCVTPDGKEGACTQVENCERIKALFQKKSLNDDDVIFVHRSQVECTSKAANWNEFVPLVCCQVSNKIVKVKDSTSTSTSSRKSILRRRRSNNEEEEEFPFPKHCGDQANNDKIINGILAQIDEFPWMALLKYKTQQGYGYGCGGALINKRYVLTAAHCVVGKFGAPVEVTLGEYDVDTPKDCTKQLDYEECSDPPQEIPVEEVIKHEEYVKAAPAKLHDIALIRLKQAASYTDFIRPICMPTQEIYDEILSHKIPLDVAGWGRTKHRPASNIKRKAKVPLVDHETCSVNRTIKIASSQICAGGGKQDSCTGDSGGPLMGLYAHGNWRISWYVCGIVSFGPSPCGIQGIASVYTNVVYYRDWIIENMKP